MCRSFPVHAVYRITSHIFPHTGRQAGVCQQAVPHRLFPVLLPQQLRQEQPRFGQPLRQYGQLFVVVCGMEREPHDTQQIRRYQHDMFHFIYPAFFAGDLPDAADTGTAADGEKAADKPVFSGDSRIRLRKVQPAGRGQFCLEPRHRQCFVIGNSFHKLQRFALGAFCFRKVTVIGQPFQSPPAVQSHLSEQHQQHQQNYCNQFHSDSFGTGTVCSSSSAMLRQVS